jgi:hypothetical protein
MWFARYRRDLLVWSTAMSAIPARASIWKNHVMFVRQFLLGEDVSAAAK